MLGKSTNRQIDKVEQSARIVVKLLTVIALTLVFTAIILVVQR